LPENTLQTGCTVTAINQTSQGYQLRVNHSGDDVKNLEHVETVTCQHLVLATPAFVSAQLLSGISPALQGVLNDIPYNTLAVMHTGFNRADIEHPLDGFGMLVPQCEKRPLLGTIFASSLFPDRAPKDQVLLTNFLGGAHHPTVWQQSDAQISQKVLQQLQALLGLQQSGLPVFQSIVRYEKAIPQYTLGHLKRLETLKVLLKQLPQPTVHLCGNYLQHIALNGCVQSGLSVARQIILDNTHNHVD
jgi:oxygen-dependent protoporphyrinogen oxidase